MQYLQVGDESGYFAWHREAHRFQRIVRVHHGVHKVVHRAEPAVGRGRFRVKVPHVGQNRRVMIVVEKDELLLAQHNEHGVDELGQLADHEQKRPVAGDAVHVVAVADGVLETSRLYRVHHFGPHANGAEDGEDGEADVPEDEQYAQTVRSPVGHEEFESEYGGQIGDADVEAEKAVLAEPGELGINELVIEIEGLVEVELGEIVARLGLVDALLAERVAILQVDIGVN